MQTTQPTPSAAIAEADLTTPYGNAIHQLSQVATTFANCLYEHKSVLDPELISRVIGPIVQPAVDAVATAYAGRQAHAQPRAQRPGPLARARWMAAHSQPRDYPAGGGEAQALRQQAAADAAADQ